MAAIVAGTGCLTADFGFVLLITWRFLICVEIRRSTLLDALHQDLDPATVLTHRSVPPSPAQLKDKTGGFGWRCAVTQLTHATPQLTTATKDSYRRRVLLSVGFGRLLVGICTLLVRLRTEVSG